MTSSANLSTDPVVLEAEIATATARFNELRLAGAPIDEAKRELSDLKKALAMAKGAAGGREKKEQKEARVADAGKKDGKEALEGDKKKERLLLKTAKVCISRLLASL